MIELTKPLIYITRDIERALGLPLDTPHYYIITNDTTYASQLAKTHDNIILISGEKQRDTWELLEHDTATKKITELNADIVVFKNTPKIERICKEHNWHLLNPSAELSTTVEEKISQVAWLDDLAHYLPPHSITRAKDVLFHDKKFILQFNRAHTGTGTILIESEKQLDEIKQTFPHREVRVTEFIDGPMFTVNIVVGKDETLIGNISYQITVLCPFTENKFATIGNDWGLPKNILDRTQIELIEQIGTDIAHKLRDDGWKGLFGVDVVLDQKTGKLHLIEINCRQPASTTYESILQQNTSPATLPSAHNTIFEAHILSLLDKPPDTLIPIKDGAQIIQRVTEFVPELPEPKCYTPASFDYIRYDNTKPGSDLLRMMTKTSVMADHNTLNDTGNMLMDFIFITKYKNSWNMPRGAAIIIKDHNILLIERHKLGRHYFVLPGGTLEEGETLEETTIREVKEETCLDIRLRAEEPIIINDRGRESHHFFADIIAGEEKLSGPECKINSIENHYALRWIDLDRLPEINFVPPDLKEILLSKFLK